MKKAITLLQKQIRDDAQALRASYAHIERLERDNELLLKRIERLERANAKLRDFGRRAVYELYGEVVKNQARQKAYHWAIAALAVLSILGILF